MDGLIKRTNPPMQPAPVSPVAVPPRSARVSSPIEQARPRQRRCLLVDDSRMIRKIARGILEGVGYTVDEAENGAEALAKCRAAMPGLILLDWHMPVMSGLEFVTALRAMGGPVRPKVMFCTTNSDSLDIHKGIDAGADEYIIKPFDQAGLHAKLQRLGEI